MAFLNPILIISGQKPAPFKTFYCFNIIMNLIRNFSEEEYFQITQQFKLTNRKLLGLKVICVCVSCDSYIDTLS